MKYRFIIVDIENFLDGNSKYWYTGIIQEKMKFLGIKWWRNIKYLEGNDEKELYSRAQEIINLLSKKSYE